MEKELIKLYSEYLKALDIHNKNKDIYEDEQYPSFETFMKWLKIRDSEVG